jgi:hypothetical protein
MNLQLLFVILLQIPLRKIVRFQNGKDSSYNSHHRPLQGACIEPGESTVKVLWHQEVVVILSNGFESNSTTILFTGSIYSPSISKTTTHYVRTSTGPDLVSGCQWLLQFILPHHWWVCLFRLRMPYVKGSTYIYCKWWWFIWIFNWWDYKAANVRKQRVSNYYVEKVKSLALERGMR